MVSGDVIVDPVKLVNVAVSAAREQRCAVHVALQCSAAPGQSELQCRTLVEHLKWTGFLEKGHIQSQTQVLLYIV